MGQIQQRMITGRCLQIGSTGKCERNLRIMEVMRKRRYKIDLEFSVGSVGGHAWKG